MGGARALIASLGASFSLVAGAALSLLVVSFVFAYDGISGGIDAPPVASALVLESDASQAAPSAGKAPAAVAAVVLKPAAPAAAPAQRPVQRPQRVRGSRPASTQPAFHPGVRNLNPPSGTDPAPPVSVPAAGDGVRDVGDAVTATVQGTGKSAGEATTPLLGPPVSQAVQDVLDLLTAIVQGATDALGGVLDKTLPR